MKTVYEIGRKPFHLTSIDIEKGEALLHIVWCPIQGNEARKEVVSYPFPKHFPGEELGKYSEVIEALARECPLHMIGFEEIQGELALANATTVWGYVCPCQFL